MGRGGGRGGDGVGGSPSPLSIRLLHPIPLSLLDAVSSGHSVHLEVCRKLFARSCHVISNSTKTFNLRHFRFLEFFFFFKENA